MKVSELVGALAQCIERAKSVDAEALESAVAYGDSLHILMRDGTSFVLRVTGTKCGGRCIACHRIMADRESAVSDSYCAACKPLYE